jgi:hypothetical protein
VALETGATPVRAMPVPTSSATAPTPAAPASTLTAAAPVSIPAPPVLDVLREEIARILCCDPWDIDTAEPFTVLGVDTAMATEFVSVINLVYGLHEHSAVLYDHPNLTALASHIAAQLPIVSDPLSGPMPMEELLGAVRDGRVTVDQALTLLPRQN